MGHEGVAFEALVRRRWFCGRRGQIFTAPYSKETYLRAPPTENATIATKKLEGLFVLQGGFFTEKRRGLCTAT